MRFFFKYCDLNYTHIYIVKNAAHKSKSKSSLILFIVFTSVSQPASQFLHRKYPVCLISKFRITFLSKCLRKPKQSRKIQRKCFLPLFNRQSCAALNMKKKNEWPPAGVFQFAAKALCYPVKLHQSSESSHSSSAAVAACFVLFEFPSFTRVSV